MKGKSCKNLHPGVVFARRAAYNGLGQLICRVGVRAWGVAPKCLTDGELWQDEVTVRSAVRVPHPAAA